MIDLTCLMLNLINIRFLVNLHFRCVHTYLKETVRPWVHGSVGPSGMRLLMRQLWDKMVRHQGEMAIPSFVLV